MEILGVLEPEDVPKESIWYAFAPSGEAPSPRVGHTCLYVPDPDAQGKGKVVIVGGADPGCCYSDAHIINLGCFPKLLFYIKSIKIYLDAYNVSLNGLDHETGNVVMSTSQLLLSFITYTYEWINPDWKDLLPRYEHACFTSSSDPTRIWVFGGAEQAENRNSVQVISPGLSWKNPNVEGPCPSPRTFHTSSSAIGDKFYVFGGGEKGAEPAADNKLHVFDTISLTWMQPVTSGDPPKPRHGHTITAVGSKLFIHGGMAGSSFFSDMFCIDTDTMTWEQLRTKGEPPPPCAAHSSVCWKNFIYIFGGMTETGPISTMYRFDTEEHLWAQMKFESPSPPSRLDHSMCLVPWKIRADASAEDHKSVPICLIFGGMDTAGELFNDCYVTTLQE